MKLGETVSRTYAHVYVAMHGRQGFVASRETHTLSIGHDLRRHPLRLFRLLLAFQHHLAEVQKDLEGRKQIFERFMSDNNSVCKAGAFSRCGGRCDAICDGGVRCILAKYHSQKK